MPGARRGSDVAWLALSPLRYGPPRPRHPRPKRGPDSSRSADSALPLVEDVVDLQRLPRSRRRGGHPRPRSRAKQPCRASRRRATPLAAAVARSPRMPRASSLTARAFMRSSSKAALMAFSCPGVVSRRPKIARRPKDPPPRRSHGADSLPRRPSRRDLPSRRGRARGGRNLRRSSPMDRRGGRSRSRSGARAVRP